MTIREQYMHLIDQVEQNRKRIEENKSQIPETDIYCSDHEVYLTNIIDDAIESASINPEEYPELNDIVSDLNTLKLKLNTLNSIKTEFRDKNIKLHIENREIYAEFKESLLKDYPQLSSLVQIEISAFKKVNIDNVNIYHLIKEFVPHVYSYIKYENRLIIIVDSSSNSIANQSNAFDFLSGHIPNNLDKNIKGHLSVTPINISLVDDYHIILIEDIIKNINH